MTTTDVCDDDTPEDTEEQGRHHPGHGEVKVAEEVDPDPGQAPESDLLEDADHGVDLGPGLQGDRLPLLVTLHDVCLSLFLLFANVVANQGWPRGDWLTMHLWTAVLCRREVVAGAGQCRICRCLLPGLGPSLHFRW